MRFTIFILAASVLVVSSSSPESSAPNSSEAARPPRSFFYYHQYAIPTVPNYYNRIPLAVYHPAPSYPVDLIEPSSPFDSQRSQTNQAFKTATPSLDQKFSDEDAEAIKQLELIKDIYAEKESNGVVMPSIIPMPRGFLLLKASAFASLISAFSITSANIVKTKTIYYPSFG